jgi:2'-hydroxyisoflavone reductase
MHLLILGGTQFLGRYLVQTALFRGHQITIFNRGKTNPELFPEIEKLTGDRNGDLKALEGRRWDAVVDTCGFVSEQVHDAAGMLANFVEHYTFISSISVYRDFCRIGQDESAPLAQLPNGTDEDANDASSYGARKALCELAAEGAMPGRVLSIRPGIIVGPHDTTGRFIYWGRRASRGGEILSPGRPDAALQLIDVRDLALWTIRMIENRRVGSYNASSPQFNLTLGGMLEACNTTSKAPAHNVWVDEQFLLDKGVAPFADLPFWIPSGAKDHAGFFEIDSSKAVREDLHCRPMAETVEDTLLWDNSRSQPGEYLPSVGLTPERERSLLEMWKRIQPQMTAD